MTVTGRILEQSRICTCHDAGARAAAIVGGAIRRRQWTSWKLATTSVALGVLLRRPLTPG